MRRLWSRFAGLLGLRHTDRDLDDEVGFHLDMLTSEYIRRGMGVDEARAAARRSFGGAMQMKEEYRERRGVPVLETLAHDTRYAVRTLLRTPGFTLAALVTLALGIGANSAIFSVVNAVLLRPLDYPEPERIVQMHRNNGGLWTGQSGRRYLFWRDQMKSLDALAAWRGVAFNMVAGNTAEYVNALSVSKEYFTVFGGVPLHGRLFRADEDVENGPDVVILSHRIWRRMFGGDPGVIGRSISLGDRSFTIVGVMRPGFDEHRPQELYVPLRPSVRGFGGGFNYTVAGRLRAGLPREQADAESATVFEAYKSETLATNPQAEFGRERAPVFLPYQEALAEPVRPALLMMLGAVGLLLLIACANTANLLLARASGRGREIAVRAALGAARGRIIRQLLTESVVLFTAGGLLGVLLAYWAVPALVALTPASYVPLAEVAVDGTVLVATLTLSVLTGILFGLAPALSLSRHDLVEAFKEDAARTTGGRRSGWTRRTLVIAEVSLCMLLLIGAGLLIQTFVRLRAVDPGFDARNVLTARMSLLGERYNTAAAVNRLYDLGLDRIRRIPGIESAAVVNGVPMEMALNLNVDFLETEPVETELIDWRYATADYFQTMKIPIVAGRGFAATDAAGAPKVAVVSEEFARRFYKDGNALGRRVSVFRQDGPIEIVGVARNLREHGLRGPIPAVMYVPVAQTHDNAVRTTHAYFQVSWVVRAASLTPELTQRMREELRSIDPKQPITAFRSMDEIKARAMATETFQMTLLTLFAAVGLLLAGAGIYGVIAYSVAQRRREFGIRLALGSSQRRILTSVVRQGAGLALAGVAVGAVAAVWLTKALRTFVFGVSTLHLPTFAAVALLLMVVAILASLIPALRAVKLNPIAALRE